jgi:hypothetical protein
VLAPRRVAGLPAGCGALLVTAGGDHSVAVLEKLAPGQGPVAAGARPPPPPGHLPIGGEPPRICVQAAAASLPRAHAAGGESTCGGSHAPPAARRLCPSRCPPTLPLPLPAAGPQRERPYGQQYLPLPPPSDLLRRLAAAEAGDGGQGSAASQQLCAAIAVAFGSPAFLLALFPAAGEEAAAATATAPLEDGQAMAVDAPGGGEAERMKNGGPGPASPARSIEMGDAEEEPQQEQAEQRETEQRETEQKEPEAGTPQQEQEAGQAAVDLDLKASQIRFGWHVPHGCTACTAWLCRLYLPAVRLTPARLYHTLR